MWPSSRICRLIRRKHCEQALGEAMALEKYERRTARSARPKYPIGVCRERHEILFTSPVCRVCTSTQGRTPEQGNDYPVANTTRALFHVCAVHSTSRLNRMLRLEYTMTNSRQGRREGLNISIRSLTLSSKFCTATPSLIRST
jgi:hypothetical protein